MKVLLVSWEYPPVVIGGLGRHVHHLATALAEAGHEVVVLSRRPSGTDPSTHPSSDDVSEGVRVVAAAQDPHEFDFGTDMMAWILAMGHSMIRAGLALKTRERRTTKPWVPDVVHAHDWLVAHPSIALAEHFDVPLVSTIHATEAGRHSGWVAGTISRQVHALESWLVRESDSLITCSASMNDEIATLFGPGLPESRVIRNGIDAALWPFAPRTPHDGPPRLLYLGRLEYEKGVHDAIAALPRIRRAHPGTTLTVAGDGTQQDFLVEEARKHKVRRAITFVGRVNHGQLVALLHECDAAVLPSHYEPFGIVALEAAATGAPLVTSTAGGLGEAVIEGETGMSFPPRDVAALASAVRAVLDDPAAAQRRANAARTRLNSDFDWHTVAAETAQVYLAAKRREREPHGRRVIVEHPLPTAADAVTEVIELFPPGTDTDGDGTLVVGGCRLDDLANEFGTPVMVVDEGALRRRAREYLHEFRSRRLASDVAFASKSFPGTAIQRLMTEEGLHLDVAGGGEIITAMAAGADPARMILHGNAKSDEELELAVQEEVGLVVVDNFDDIDRLERIVVPGRTQACLVRVIPGVEAATHASVATGHAGSKFGLMPEDARTAITRIERSSVLRCDGLHTHVGSQLLDVEQLAAAVAPLAALGTFDVYDLGGGLGVRYTYDEQPPTVADYAEAMTAAADALLPRGCRVIVEPGRSMVATSACTVYRVTTVKHGTLTHVAVDGGMGDNLEVSLYGQRFEATVVDRVGGGARVNLVGRHCESGDQLIDGVALQDPAVGDLVAVPVTGAYCYTMSNQYNGARRIPVVFVDDGRARLVVRRDTWEDLLARDVN